LHYLYKGRALYLEGKSQKGAPFVQEIVGKENWLYILTALALYFGFIRKKCILIEKDHEKGNVEKL
jgi:hypothetical protein